MSWTWDRVDLDPCLRQAVEQIRREQGALLDTWEAVRKRAKLVKNDFFEELEEHWSGGMVHGQPVPVEDSAYFLCSWVTDVHGRERRVYQPCWMGSGGEVERHPLSSSDEEEYFTSQNEALAVLYNMASAHADEQARQEKDRVTITYAPDEE